MRKSFLCVWTEARDKNNEITLDNGNAAVIIPRFSLVQDAEITNLHSLQKAILDNVKTPLNITTGKFFYKTSIYIPQRCVIPDCKCSEERDSHFVSSDDDVFDFCKSSGPSALFFVTRDLAEVQTKLMEEKDYMKAINEAWGPDSPPHHDPVLWQGPPSDWPSDWPWLPFGTATIFAMGAPDLSIELMARYEALKSGVHDVCIPFIATAVFKEAAQTAHGPSDAEIPILEDWLCQLPLNPYCLGPTSLKNMTPLAIVITSGFGHCLQLYLSHGVDITSHIEIENPLMFAVAGSQAGILAQLLAYSKGKSGIPQSRNEMKQLMANAYEINWRTSQGDAIMNVACSKASSRVVSLLVCSGANTRITNVVPMHVPQWFAIVNGRSDLLPLLYTPDDVNVPLMYPDMNKEGNALEIALEMRRKYSMNASDWNKCITWLLMHGFKCDDRLVEKWKKKNKEVVLPETLPPYISSLKCSFRFCSKHVSQAFTADQLWPPIMVAGGTNVAGDRISGNLLTCGGCGMRGYCSSECQVADWKFGGHKKVCGELKALKGWLSMS